MADKYYTSKKSKLLKEFDKNIKQVRRVFVTRYGEGLTQAFMREARQEYEAIIPDLPYLGGKRPFTQFIISTGWFLAMYRTLKKHGRTVEEAGSLVYEVSEAFLKAYPGYLRRLVGYMNFSPRYLKKLRERAAESQKPLYPMDYVFTFIEGDGKTFDYGVDYSACAGCQFLEAQEAPELAPYLCAIDEIYSNQLGWGLVRTMTIAEGYEKCDFRFKKGGKTDIVLPAVLKHEAG